MAYSFVLLRKQYICESSALMNVTTCRHCYECVIQSNSLCDLLASKCPLKNSMRAVLPRRRIEDYNCHRINQGLSFFRPRNIILTSYILVYS